MSGFCRRNTMNSTIALLVTLLVLAKPTWAVPGGSGEGCSRFCRTTGFAGTVGNCACGLSLFAKRNSRPLAMPGLSMEDWEELERKRRSVDSVQPFNQDKVQHGLTTIPLTWSTLSSRTLPRPPP